MHDTQRHTDTDMHVRTHKLPRLLPSRASLQPIVAGVPMRGLGTPGPPWLLLPLPGSGNSLAVRGTDSARLSGFRPSSPTHTTCVAGVSPITSSHLNSTDSNRFTQRLAW